MLKLYLLDRILRSAHVIPRIGHCEMKTLGDILDFKIYCTKIIKTSSMHESQQICQQQAVTAELQLCSIQHIFRIKLYFKAVVLNLFKDFWSKITQKSNFPRKN